MRFVFSLVADYRFSLVNLFWYQWITLRMRFDELYIHWARKMCNIYSQLNEITFHFDSFFNNPLHINMTTPNAARWVNNWLTSTSTSKSPNQLRFIPRKCASLIGFVSNINILWNVIRHSTENAPEKTMHFME